MHFLASHGYQKRSISLLVSGIFATVEIRKLFIAKVFSSGILSSSNEPEAYNSALREVALRRQFRERPGAQGNLGFSEVVWEIWRCFEMLLEMFFSEMLDILDRQNKFLHIHQENHFISHSGFQPWQQ